MTAGRPTTYSQDMLQRAKKYVEGGYLEQGDAIPSVVGVARYLGVATSTVHLWGEAHPEFSDTLSECKDEQHRITLSNALTGKFNATISKLVLHNHGYSERQDVALTSPDGSMTPRGLDASQLSTKTLQELMRAKSEPE